LKDKARREIEDVDVLMLVAEVHLSKQLVIAAQSIIFLILPVKIKLSLGTFFYILF
jgi:hypothetical protein